MPIRHLVLFRFASEATPAQIERIVRDFSALPQQIEGITAMETGVDHSAEGLSHGYTHIFLLSFADAAARDAYLPHPAHQAFVASLKPALAEALVLDWTVDR